MVRQAQNYFAAAVSAAVLNAAAIAGFVLLMLLSGGHVLPLAGLLNASNPFQSAADSEAAPAPDLSSGGLAGLKQRSSQFAASDGRNGAGAVATFYGARGDGANSGQPSGGGNGGSSSPQGSGSQPPSGSAPSSGGSDQGGAGPSVGSPGAPALPVGPPSGGGDPVGQAVQQVGTAAQNATSNLPGPIGTAAAALTGAVKNTGSGTGSITGAVSKGTSVTSAAPAPVKSTTSTATGTVKNATSAATTSAPAPVHTATAAIKQLSGL